MRISAGLTAAALAVMTSIVAVASESEDDLTSAYGILEEHCIGNIANNPSGEPFPRAMTDVWMDNDGTAYITAPLLFGSDCTGVWKDGSLVGKIYGFTGLVIAGNSSYIFSAESNAVYIVEKKTDAIPRLFTEFSFVPDADFSVNYPDGYGIRGLLATEKYLYIANTAESKIEKWNISQKRKVSEFPFVRPGDMAKSPDGDIWVIRDGVVDSKRKEIAVVNSDISIRDAVIKRAAVIKIDYETGVELESLNGFGVPVSLEVIENWRDGRPALLVADNGESQQVQVYTRRFPVSKFTQKEQIGIFFGEAHKFRGNYGFAAFSGIIGLGASSDGKIHVFQNWNVNSIRRVDYEPICSEWTVCSRSGENARILAGNFACSGSAAFSPVVPFDLFWGGVGVRASWVNLAAGDLKWHFLGRTINPFRESMVDSPEGNSKERISVIHIFGSLYLYRNRGNVVEFFRKDPQLFGNSWVFSGAVDTVPNEDGFGTLWADGSGSQPADGIWQIDEKRSSGRRYDDALASVDSLGSIWFSAKIDGSAKYGFIQWIPERRDARRLPLFQERRPVPVPSPFSEGGILWHAHDPEQNRMLVAGFRGSDSNTPIVCVYDMWGRAGVSGTDTLVDHEIILASNIGTVREQAPGEFPLDMKIADGMLFALYGDPVRVCVYDIVHGNMIATLKFNTTRIKSRHSKKEMAIAVSSEMADGCRWIALSGSELNQVPMLRWIPSQRPFGLPECMVYPIGHQEVDGVHLEWSTGNSGVIVGYNVYRKKDGEVEFTKLNADPIASAVYIDKDLQSGKMPEYRISIVNKYGEGKQYPLRK